MDAIARTVRQITDEAVINDENDLKSILVLINDILGEVPEAKEFTKVTDAIISKIVEDGISLWNYLDIIGLLKTTEVWNSTSIKALKHVIWPENSKFRESYVAKSRRRFF